MTANNSKLSCPDSEDLAALIDRRVSVTEREQLVDHLNQCEGCYTVFSEAVQFRQEEPTRAKIFIYARPTRRKLAYAAMASLAAAAAMILIARPPLLHDPTGVSQELADRIVGLSATDLSRHLTLRGDESLPEDIWVDSSATFSFSGATTPEARAFRIGVHLIGLHICLHSNRQEQALIVLDQLNPLLDIIPMSSGSVQASDIRTALREDQRPESLFKMLSNLEAQLTNIIDPRSLTFGQWTEAGRLAARSQNGQFFSEKIFTTYLERSRDEVTPQIARELDHIRSLVIEGLDEETNFDGLERAFTQIILLH